MPRLGDAYEHLQHRFFSVFLASKGSSYSELINGELTKTRIVRGSDYSLAIALSEDKDIFRGITLFEKLMSRNNPYIYQLSKNQILTSIKGCNSVANLRKMTLYNPNVELSMKMCIQNLVKFCSFILKIRSKNQFLMSIKGPNSVPNLQKTTIYNRNVDLVNDNVYTNFG